MADEYTRFVPLSVWPPTLGGLDPGGVAGTERDAHPFAEEPFDDAAAHAAAGIA